MLLAFDYSLYTTKSFIMLGDEEKMSFFGKNVLFYISYAFAIPMDTINIVIDLLLLYII